MKLIHSVHRYDTKEERSRLVLGDEKEERCFPMGGMTSWE